MDLWPLLRGEPNILKLTNRLHPNQNQCVHATELISRLKRLGTQFHPTLIIPPSLKTLEQLVSSLKEVEASAEENCSLSSISSSEDSSYTEPLFGGDIIHQMEEMQHPEEEKLRICDAMDTPQGIGIDANDEVNGRSSSPVTPSNERPVQRVSRLAQGHSKPRAFHPREEIRFLDQRHSATDFSQRARNTVGNAEPEHAFLRPGILGEHSIDRGTARVVSFLPVETHSHPLSRPSSLGFLSTCRWSNVSLLPSRGRRTFSSSGVERCPPSSPSRTSVTTTDTPSHNTANSGIAPSNVPTRPRKHVELSVMSTYRSVADKVTCLRNAVNILTRLLETIFSVVAAA